MLKSLIFLWHGVDLIIVFYYFDLFYFYFKIQLKLKKWRISQGFLVSEIIPAFFG